LGGSIATAKNLLSGLLAQNVSLSALTGAAGVGAVVGGVLGAVVGGRGGFRLAKGLQKVQEWSQGALQGDAKLPEMKLAEKSSVVDLAHALSPWRMGVNIADFGLSLGDALSPAPMSALPMSGILAGGHIASAFLHLLGNEAQAGTPTHTWHVTSAIADAITAGGHALGQVVGPTIWGLPVVAVGAALNTVADYRYRHSAEGQAPETVEKRRADWTANGPVAAGSALIGAASALTALGSANPVSGALGAGELLAGTVYTFSAMNGNDSAEYRRRFALGQGHLLMALGSIGAATGGGVWSVAPILGGMVSNTLSQIR
jgi:hypothetical protein